MCGGLEFQRRSGETVKVLFPNPKAAMLVNQPMNLWLPWGRRREEPGDWPEGGWARYESLNKGYWRRWGSERVLIWPIRWMEKDRQRSSQWFELPPGHAMVCLRLTKAPGTPLYVVTSEADGDYLADIHDRIPKLMPVTAAIEAHRAANTEGEFDDSPLAEPFEGDPTFGIELSNALLYMDKNNTLHWSEEDVRKWFRADFAPRFPELIHPWSEDAAVSLAFSELLIGPGRHWGLAKTGPRREPGHIPEKPTPDPKKTKSEATPLPMEE